jgi:iron-sulfur cluster protein
LNQSFLVRYTAAAAERSGANEPDCSSGQTHSMTEVRGLRCRHAFEFVCVHANGDVVCSRVDGRGDFVIGNVHQHSLSDIFAGARAQELRRLVLSTADSYCSAIGKKCPLKSIPFEPGEDPPAQIRFLAIEPTTACDLRCLSCPVRDFTGDVTWRNAYRDGGVSFLLWDGLRRSKQHAADGIWQYVVFRWNDRDDQFKRAMALAEELGIQIHFDFAHTWGRSRRNPDDLRYLAPYLKPFTALPGERRQDGW